MIDDETLQKVCAEIAHNHRKIIDDWCKAYMAQLYEEGVQIKPGCFTLNEQVPTYHKGQDCMVRKYWFEPRIPEFDDDNK
jgi:hypothetical protein